MLRVVIATALVLVAAACGGDETTSNSVPTNTAAVASPSAESATPTATPDNPAPTVSQTPTPLVVAARTLEPFIVREYSHDPAAFTQGLQFVDGRLYESRGRYGQSALTEIDAETGSVQRAVPVDQTYFAEGLAVVDDRLIQLTWKAGKAFVYDLETFEQVGQFEYEGEGWGLCFDGARLVMSNGSDALTYRDPETFEPVGKVTVTLDGQALGSLNELECVGDTVYANVWRTDFIVAINPAGAITALINAQALADRISAPGADVLNGMAYNPDTETFWVTGKYWPTMYEVTLEQVD